jgi:hypothetical protein
MARAVPARQDKGEFRRGCLEDNKKTYWHCRTAVFSQRAFRYTRAAMATGLTDLLGGKNL